MKSRRILAAVAFSTFSLSFFMPAYTGYSGLVCLDFCWDDMVHLNNARDLGWWLYLSGFVIANALFVALLVAFLFLTRLTRVRMWFAVVVTLQVLSWLVLNIIPGIRAPTFDLKIGYFVWLLSYLLLAGVHIGIKVVPNQLPDPTSPSVTPRAGAGGAPSVAADH
jgi:hypothetical protein